MCESNSIRRVGVLLAAGAGMRFGGAYAGAKLDQSIDGVAVGIRAFDTMHAHCDATVVVVRSLASALATHATARGGTAVLARDAAQGMGASLADGARYAMATYPNALFLLVSMADMPWIDKSTYSRLCDIFIGDAINSQYTIAQPIFQPAPNAEPALVAARARPGHPVAFGRAHWSALAALTGDSGARRVIERERKHLISVETTDAGIWRDVDTAADLPQQPRTEGS